MTKRTLPDQLPEHIKGILANVAEQVANATRRRIEADQAMVDAIRQFEKDGIEIEDAAELLGISVERAKELAAAE